MNTRQDQPTANDATIDLKTGVDAQKRLSLVRSTSRPDPLAPPVTDRNRYTQKTRAIRISDPWNSRSQHIDHVPAHEPMIAAYKSANLTRRLQMYLRFPFLKTEFDLINRNDRQLKTTSDFELRIQSFAHQMGMAMGSAMTGRGQ